MAIKALNPYLNFNGSAEAAIRLYQSALGAELQGPLMRFGDMPAVPDTPTCAPEQKNHVMHSQLKVGGGVIMVSDTMRGGPMPPGGQVQVTLHFDDPVDMAQKFEALASGGTVTMPLGDTFWGAKFGMLTDAFGIQWMFNCDL
ncbi:MAG: glyoxalase/bleomycin resistance/extradiol dioxygenase family protein [Myxococcales bacterium]|nr:glyoxalase/bleomycin resistance/extradiol dioxygenase family protein [Myxococcales bacterium]